MNKEYVYQYIKQNAYEIYYFLISNKERHLFGTGQQAVNCIYLLSLLKVPISGIIVSQKKEEEFMGLPVLQIDDAEISRKDKAVLLSVNIKLAIEIKENLKYLGYEEIYCCSDWEKINDVIKEAVSLDFYLDNGVNVSDDYIILENCKYLNPFRKERKYKQMLLGTVFTDLIVPGIMRKDIYGKKLLYDLIREKIRNTDCIFDIGANVGVFAGYAASLGKRVVAFEPCRSILPYLYKNAALYDNIDVEEYAVSDKDSFLDFYDKIEYSKYSTTVRPKDNEYEIYQIESITIDTYAVNKMIAPQFIKVDTYGTACQVIAGGRKYIAEYRPNILVGLEGEKNISLIETLILDCDSEYKIVKEPGYLYCYEGNGG